MKKKAILVVSFGSSHADTREKTIDRIEKEMEEQYPEYRIYRAYTSRIILQILRNRDRIFIPTVKEAMEKMIADGIEEVIVQPTHIVDGIENDQMKRDVLGYQKEFQEIRISTPLLAENSDYSLVVEALMEYLKKEETAESILFMGHGTTHENNICYQRLEQTFHEKGYTNVFIGTVEAEPTLSDVMKRLKETPYQTITLLPFMVVAGDHAKNDMVCDEGDSWKSMLESEGYGVTCILKGIGENSGIRNIYLKHLQECLKEQEICL